MKRLIDSVVKWPLLIGAVTCLILGLSMAANDGDRRSAMVVLVTLGALLLGAWLWALATHTNPPSREPENEDEPSA